MLTTTGEHGITARVHGWFSLNFYLQWWAQISYFAISKHIDLTQIWCCGLINVVGELMHSWVFINSEKQSVFWDTSYTQEFNESPVFIKSLQMAVTSVGPFCQSVSKVNVFPRGWCRLTRGLFQLSQVWAPGGKRWALFPEGYGLHKSFLFLIALLTPFHRLYDNFHQTEHQCCIYVMYSGVWERYSEADIYQD